jgi:anthranilate phosphoribosyltransferase
MLSAADRELGCFIGRVIAGEDLSREESYHAFCLLLGDEVAPMQQGGFLAALTAKGETVAELAGGWQAICDLDTRQVDLGELALIDNCGTGMDSFKTFNISTAAALVGAAGGLPVARHGARAITSTLGTVDLVERLGVDVDCPVEMVAASIREAGIGLFNGMSPEVHPGALARILGQLSFGSPLNIVASLAHPARPQTALRGVYSRDMVRPIAEVMAAIGYRRALVVHGGIDGSPLGMDEASVCGVTSCAELRDGMITEFLLQPEECGLARHLARPLAADPTPEEAARKIYRLLAGQADAARADAVSLNAGLLFYLAGRTATIAAGVALAAGLLGEGQALVVLRRWVNSQNRKPQQGLAILEQLARQESEQ